MADDLYKAGKAYATEAMKRIGRAPISHELLEQILYFAYVAGHTEGWSLGFKERLARIEDGQS